MSKRLQVLVDETEYAHLQQLAASSGMTLAEWVRQALRLASRTQPSGSRQKKLAAVRASAQQEFPTADIDQMLDEIGSGYDLGLSS